MTGKSREEKKVKILFCCGQRCPRLLVARARVAALSGTSSGSKAWFLGGRPLLRTRGCGALGCFSHCSQPLQPQGQAASPRGHPTAPSQGRVVPSRCQEPSKQQPILGARRHPGLGGSGNGWAGEWSSGAFLIQRHLSAEVHGLWQNDTALPVFQGKAPVWLAAPRKPQQLVCRVAEGHFGCCISSPLLPLLVVLLQNLQMYQA